ncbi:MAG: hypothetical protein N3F64_05635 [Nitrososphaeria archaeon]|nr:hypothetical protein [Nitrososphaeria archaeon]
MIKKRLEQNDEYLDKMALEVFRYIKSAGYIDKKSIMNKFNLDYNELERIFYYLERKELLKPVLKECKTNLCKNCPHITNCNFGKIKFYVLGE